jgi:hypothetical protein
MVRVGAKKQMTIKQQYFMQKGSPHILLQRLKCLKNGLRLVKWDKGVERASEAANIFCFC